MEEGRKRERIKYEYSVMSFKAVTDESGDTKSNKVLRISVNDLSYSGIGININHKVEKGDSFKMNLSYAYEILEYDLTVQWCRGSNGTFSAGCSFSNLTREKLYLLDRIIKAKRK